MRMTLRPYQQESVDKVREAFGYGHRSVILVEPTGAGKTVEFAYITEKAMLKGKRVLILVHRKELLRQCSKALDDIQVNHGCISPDYPHTWDDVQVASIQTLGRRLDKIEPPDMIIVDECFMAGTLIDARPIETIREGDFVKCYDHEQKEITRSRVTKTFKNETKTQSLLQIIFSDDTCIYCTPNHPFYDAENDCYIRAIDLSYDSVVLTITHKKDVDNDRVEMQGMREVSLCEMEKISMLSRMQVNNKQSNDGEDKPQIRIRTDAEKQSYEKIRNKRKSFHISQGDGMETNSQGRKRIFNRTAKTSRMRVRLGHGNSNPDKKRKGLRLSNLLQSRRWEYRSENSYRGGRKFSLRIETKSTRQKEDRTVRVVWMESIEIYKQGGPGITRSLRTDCPVYNIEVEKHHNYFANGILVHNCHHSPSPTFKKVIDKYDQARILGVTATPIRLDGKGLGNQFSHMVKGSSIKDLIKAGWLTQPLHYSVGNGLDMSAVRKLGGDYSRHDLAELMDDPKITGNAVEHYQRICPGVPAIAFCPTVAHAEHVAERFNAAGIASASLDGKMNAYERDSRLAALGNGGLLMLATCDIVSEGTDIPRVVAAIMLRHTQSMGLYLQQGGRVLRPFEGKKYSIILDHVGNYLRHFMIDDVRDWQLDCASMNSGEEKELRDFVECAHCFILFPRALRICPACGTERLIQEREIEEVDGTLRLITEIEEHQAEELKKRVARQEVGAAHTLEQLEAVAKARGYKPGWARYIFNAREKKRRMA